MYISIPTTSQLCVGRRVRTDKKMLKRQYPSVFGMPLNSLYKSLCNSLYKVTICMIYIYIYTCIQSH